ncbi:MAG: PorV/PorQ family protein [Elusimicrobiota bacterium]|nr:MAG: PorV/PorQ family protein [Elusimicrobiota bacterium]
MRALALAVLLASPALGAETATFLDVGPGARAIGLGGAYTALADDSDAVYWNPAGLARLEKRHVSLSHSALGVSNQHEFISYAHPTSRATIGAAFTYLNYGSIDGRDTIGAPTSNFTASDAAFSLAAAVKSELADFGAAVKVVNSHIGQTQATSVAVDAGLRREISAGSGKLVVGATLRNIGPGLRYENERNDLPLRANVGAAYRFAQGTPSPPKFRTGRAARVRKARSAASSRRWRGFPSPRLHVEERGDERSRLRCGARPHVGPGPAAREPRHRLRRPGRRRTREHSPLHVLRALLA